jgi:hypothetical protein
VPYLLGKTDSADLDAAAMYSSKLQARWQCKADFYVALRALREGDRAKFKVRLLGAGMAEGAAWLEDEFFLARWEIGRGFPFPAFNSPVW